MYIHIKKYHEKDRAAFQLLMSLVHEEDDLLNIIQSPRLECAYSAFHEEKLIGVVIAWTSSYHASCVYFRIVGHPFYQHSHAHEKLLAKLETLDSNLPLQTSTWETTVGMKDFLEQKGFRVIRKTYMPVLSVCACRKLESPYVESGNVKTLEEIVSNDMLLEKLVQLVKHNYEETHKDNPIAEMTLIKWKQLILVEDCVLQGSYILVDRTETEVLAYSFLHESDDHKTLELGWCGSASTSKTPFIPQLTLKQIRYADKYGYAYLEGEFDTTSEYAMEVLRLIPFLPCAAWVTYQRHEIGN